MWSWASELFGLIKPISISSAESLKPLPITGSKTYQNINKQTKITKTKSWLHNHDHIIKLKYLSLSLSQNQKRRWSYAEEVENGG